MAIAMLRSVAPIMEKHHQVVILDEAVERRSSCPSVMCRRANCPTRPSACSTPAAPASRSRSTRRPRRSKDRRRKLELLNVELEIATREVAEGQYVRAIVSPSWTRRSRRRRSRSKRSSSSGKARRPRHQADRRPARWPPRASAGEGEVESRRPACDADLLAIRDERPWRCADGVRRGRRRCGRRRGRRLDRHPRRPDGQGRDRLGPHHRRPSSRSASSARITRWTPIAKRIQTSRAKLDNPNKPVGVFMLCGPSGVGKTETAHALSELLYSGDDR
jgi:type VI secretion system protein VasG